MPPGLHSIRGIKEAPPLEERRECGEGAGQGEVEGSDLTQRNKGENLAPDRPACLGDSEAH